MPSELLDALQQRLQHRFADTGLLLRALTHRSHGAEHNERLEFLGDAVLELAVSTLLYTRMQQLPEGELSRVRALLVRQDSLHRIALRLQLPPVLRLGEGEARSGGRERPSILADAVEALIGAVFLDAGYDGATALVGRLFEGVRLDGQLQASAKDAKTALQEWLQGRRMQLPRYSVVATSGAAHHQVFEVDCEVAERSLSERGQGATRRAAEQEAAKAMLQRLKAGQ
ncbi:ribonuclease III [Comamonas sp. NLF-1-9]|uniref:ribonuclease III n=1 Tax=Comamonas sp. NLF-1-9 TaxID=2853163 RepID=UPI001C45C7B2|nr:ribonuclease III [Comamonas sp. NLF-1-9]QXL84541.1 ribonuclease III [Comamonas sp. NLF-1-9]